MQAVDRNVKEKIGRGVARAYGLRRPVCECGHREHEHDNDEACQECGCREWRSA